MGMHERLSRRNIVQTARSTVERVDECIKAVNQNARQVGALTTVSEQHDHRITVLERQHDDADAHERARRAWTFRQRWQWLITGTTT